MPTTFINIKYIDVYQIFPVPPKESDVREYLFLNNMLYNDLVNVNGVVRDQLTRKMFSVVDNIYVREVTE